MLNRGVLVSLILVSTACWCPTIEAKPNLGKKLLEATRRADTTQVLGLLAQGADVRHEEDGCTALMVAAGGCPEDVGSTSLEMVTALLGAGADPDKPHPGEGTLLIRAAVFDRTEIARALLDAHADPNLKDSDGYSALFFAAGGGNVGLVRLLLDREAAVDTKSNDGTSPLQNAAGKDRLEIVHMLLTAGANPSSADVHGQTCFITAAHAGAVDVLNALSDAKADMSARDEAGNTALMNAAYAGQLEACQWLLDHGADRDAQNKQGQTAFTYARDRGHKYVAHLLEPQGATNQSAVPGSFDGRAWTVGDTSSTGESEITEYVLPLESVNAWTELVTVQRFPGVAKRLKAPKLMEIIRGSTLEMCPSTTWTVVRQKENDVLYEWEHHGCGGHDDQHEVAKLYQDGSALIRIAWTTRNAPASAEKRATWLRVIGEYRETGTSAPSR
jgi:ankyrin repeat protein